MQWRESIERRLEFLAFPGLFKWLTMIGVVVFAAQWINPGLPQALSFDLDRILKGEVWRIFSFALAPAGNFAFSPLGVLFLFFAVMIAFLINDSLEEVWGPTRVTLYLLTAWAGLVVGQFILGALGVNQLPVGRNIYTSMFLAFTTLFPRYEFRLFLILPVQVRWIGWLAFGLMMLSVLTFPPMALVVIPTLVPYAIWVLPDFLRDRKMLARSATRRREFSRKQLPEEEAFHRCATCGRTELSDPELDFRTMDDGTEYCVEHLPEIERPARD